MKKFVCFGLLLFSIIVLSGCDRELEFTFEFLENNIASLEDDVPTFTGVQQISTANWDILSANRLNDAGFVVVRHSTNNEMGVFSMALNKMIVNFAADIDDITTFWDWVFGAYIEVEYDNDAIAVYDAMGAVALPRGEYLDYDIFGRRIVEEGEDVFLEEVSILTATGWSTTIYRVNTETGEREIEEEAVVYEVGDSYDEAARVDLTNIGLENHYRIVQNNEVFVFDEERDRQVSSFMLPDVGNRRYFDGVLFYQVQRVVEPDRRNYSFIDAATGNGVLLETFAIDLKNGKVNELKVDYLIDNVLATLVDEDNVIRYLYARIIKISDQKLENEHPRNVIINAKGEIVRDLGRRALGDLRILTEERLWDVNSDTILDFDFNYIFSGDIRAFVPGEQLLEVRHNALRGLVDLDGDVVIPFIYAEIWSDMFYEGRTIARDNNNEWWIINVDGTRSSIVVVPERFTNGLYLTYDAPNERVNIRNYTGSSVRSIDVPNVGALVYDEYIIETPFFTAAVVRIREDFDTWDANDYVYLRVQYEE